MNLDHLYFDIVSTVRCPVEDLELRISDFASLGISTLVESPLQITPFYAKQTQSQKKSNDVNPYNTRDYERKRNWTLGENKPNSNPISKAKKSPARGGYGFCEIGQRYLF